MIISCLQFLLIILKTKSIQILSKKFENQVLLLI